MSGENLDTLSPSQINSLPITPNADVKNKFQDCEETFLDEEGWKEEARGVIKDVQKYVKLVNVSEALSSSHSCIYLNLTTREEQQYTIELTSQGFKVVGSEHNTNTLSGETIYETPYALLDSISPAYRQAFGDHLTDQLLKLQAARAQEEDS